jgi:hypothetical protein
MRFAVVMRKQAIDNPWITHRWTPVEVFADSGQFEESGVAITTTNPLGRFIERDPEGETWLFRGFELDLFADEAEGYFLNATAAEPCWFVMWRLEEEYQRFLEPSSVAECGDEVNLAIPHRICLSYNEAARLIDGGESVDTVVLDKMHWQWLHDFVGTHYRPEPKKRQRPASFQGAQRTAED